MRPPRAGLRTIGAGPSTAGSAFGRLGSAATLRVGFRSGAEELAAGGSRGTRGVPRRLSPSGPGEAAVGGRAMAAWGSRQRALRLLLMVQLLAGRWRTAGAARGARGGEPGRGRGSRGRAAGLRSLSLSSGNSG